MGVSEHVVRSLDGLSVGDAFGERFFVAPEVLELALRERRVPAPPPWRWTDDTAMALSLVDVLRARGTVDQDLLAATFARRYVAEPARGYGRGAHEILSAVAQGVPWARAAGEAFEGQGSLGNGAAMRVAPLGAFFSDAAVTRVVDEARRSAAVTHAHLDAQAGAVAVAVAAWALARAEADVWRLVLSHTPAGPTREGLERAARLAVATPPVEAARLLGAGERVLSLDTVPYSVWCALRHPDDFEGALWATVAGLGDRDTTCAIVGGLVGVRAAPLPAWLAAREPLPAR